MNPSDDIGLAEREKPIFRKLRLQEKKGPKLVLSFFALSNFPLHFNAKHVKVNEEIITFLINSLQGMARNADIIYCFFTVVSLGKGYTGQRYYSVAGNL